MDIDFTKLGAAFAHMDAAKKRFDFGMLGDMSAALGAADRIDSFGVGAGLAGGRGAAIGPLVSDVSGAGLGAGFGGVASLGLAEAKLTPPGRGLSALAGPADEGLLSAAELAKPPSWMEKPSWVEKPSWTEPISGMLGAAEKTARPGVLDGLGEAGRWRGFGVASSLAGADRDLWDLDPARRGFDSLGEMPAFGKPGALGDFGTGWAGADAFYGTGGLVGAAAGLAKGPSAFDGLFKAFDGIGELVRQTSGLYEALRPHLDWWGEIAEEAVRAARRIAAEPAGPGTASWPWRRTRRWSPCRGAGTGWPPGSWSSA